MENQNIQTNSIVMKNKRVYIKPMLESETFIPQEYVAACTGMNVTWSIHCNVPTGFGFIDKTSPVGEYNRGDEKLTFDGVWGCQTWHENITLPEGEKPHANAMWQPQRKKGWWGGYVNDGKAFPVFYWKDGHGQEHRHFAIAEESSWHPENHS